MCSTLIVSSSLLLYLYYAVEEGIESGATSGSRNPNSSNINFYFKKSESKTNNNQETPLESMWQPRVQEEQKPLKTPGECKTKRDQTHPIYYTKYIYKLNSNGNIT